MQRPTAILIVLLATAASASTADGSGEAFRFEAWRRLPVQEGGRYKPLDTLARESLFKITGRTSFSDPDTGRTMDPAQLYVEMLLQWRGWDRPSDPHATGYFAGHRGDKWDRALLLPVDHAPLRKALSIAQDRRRFSLLEISEAKIRDPKTGNQVLFVYWVQNLYHDKEEDFDEFEEKAAGLAGKLQRFRTHRMGQELMIVPVKGSKTQQWISLAKLIGAANLDDGADPTGELRKAQQQFREARAAYLARSPEAFQEASDGLLATLQELGPTLGEYPAEAIIDLEVTYNRWTPLTFAWILTLIASAALVLSTVRSWKPAYVLGLTALCAGLAAMLVGLGMRWAIKGQPPVTNLYESVVFTGFGTAVIGLVFGLRAGRRGILAIAAVVTTMILVLADSCPSVLDPAIRPLMALLRHKVFLAIHVMTIMLGYAGLALAAGIGNVTLGYYLVGPKSKETIRVQSRFTYKSLQVGVLLLLVGTILGGLWADYSWGRFWGWDKKEVWALISLLGYLAILHARCTGWIGNWGLTIGAVFCFFLVVMTWYGVNFLSGGLHNYGLSGGEGPVVVLAAAVLQMGYALAAYIRSAG